MKQLFAAICIALVSLSSCEKDMLIGSGSITSEQRSVNGFTKIEVQGSTDLTVKHGTSFKVEAKAYTSLLPYLETKLVGDVLRIGYRAGTSVSYDNSEVIITMPLLTRVHTSGNSTIDILSGTADVLKAFIIGSSKVNAFGFTAKEADISIEGSGNMELSVTEKLDAKITGSGNVYYKGNPLRVTTSITGSGKVIKR